MTVNQFLKVYYNWFNTDVFQVRVIENDVSYIHVLKGHELLTNPLADKQIILFKTSEDLGNLHFIDCK